MTSLSHRGAVVVLECRASLSILNSTQNIAVFVLLE